MKTQILTKQKYKLNKTKRNNFLQLKISNCARTQNYNYLKKTQHHRGDKAKKNIDCDNIQEFFCENTQKLKVVQISQIQIVTKLNN